MDKFCGSKFWDANVTWYTEDPDLTPCFQKTVLVWFPCVFLWTFSSVETYYLLYSKSRDIPWNMLNVTKLVLTVALTVLSIADVGFSLCLHQDGVKTHSVDYYVPVVKIITFSLSAFLVIYNRKCGLRTSGVLFFFWLLLALCGAVQFRDELRKVANHAKPEPLFPTISYLIYYPIVNLMFLLNCFSDAVPSVTDHAAVENPCPELSASFLSKTLYSWFDSMVWKGFRTPLDVKDLWCVNPDDASRVVVPLFDKYWQVALQTKSKVSDLKEAPHKTTENTEFSGRTPRKKSEASIVPVIFKAFGPTYLFGSALKLIEDILKFSSPVILSLLINFVESDEPAWKGYLYAVLMLVLASTETLVLAQYFKRMYIVGLRIRTALISAIYRKALRLSNASRKESTVGEIVNLMSVDAQRFMDLSIYFNLLWSAPFQIGLALYFLWQTLGPSVLAGLVVMLILIPINGLLISRMEKQEDRQMKYKDERVKLLNEILNGIKVLKLYAWEGSFEEQILKIRTQEQAVLRIKLILDSSMSLVWTAAPVLVSLVTFGTYMLVDEKNILTPEKAFVSLTLFNMIRMPLAMLPSMIVDLIQARVSVKRMNKYMNMEELDPRNVFHEESFTHSLVIQKGSFSWGPDEEPVLKNINLQFKDGALVAVVGSIGSGKSSLISAILGEMNKLGGHVNVKGSIAYVPQQAWIQNASLKDNIVFEKTINQPYYMKVIEACALMPDFEMLPAGDQTEIGEKGINLSGGQKQRVSLARAVYSIADIYLLDDPLSAVDSHVGKHIFKNVVGPTGILKKKTRVLVAHSMTYLPEVDLIVVLNNGEVTEMGTYKELLDKKGGFAEFVMQHCKEVGEAGTTSLTDINDVRSEGISPQRDVHQLPTRMRSRVSESHSETGSLTDRRSLSIMSALHRQCSTDSSPDALVGSFQRLNENTATEPVSMQAGERLIEDEKVEIGKVKWHVYAHYIKSIGWVMCVATIIATVAYEGFIVGSNVWLSKWSNSEHEHHAGNSSEDRADKFMYLGVYTLLGLGSALASFFCGLMPQLGCWMAARVLHSLMLKRILRAPVSFFDTTPLGRIIGRFSKDVDVLDTSLPGEVDSLIYTFFEVIATVFVITYTTPVFLAVILPIGLLYFLIQQFYVPTSRQLYRLESITRSPIFSHFRESITGAATIRAYKLQDQFILESERKVDLNQVCYYPGMISNRWLGIRIEMIGNLIIFFAMLFAVLARETMNPGLVGLSVSYSLQITSTLSWLVTLISDMETYIVAVERIKEYGEAVQEAPWNLPCTRDLTTWPDAGQVEFKDYQVRYRDGLDLVLKGISFSVKGGEKVGIVGRTGAGKSSLTLALFRIIEAAQGTITIDGIDISKLGLHALRSRLTIIPQDPILFSGTLRLNLDPFGTYSDQEVWRALEHAHLKEFVTGLMAGLSHEVMEGGDNLSVGQKQLICLARALLRKTKVLILDEATAAVDLETDDLIQKTIREEFTDCTVLTIAHRLNTIMDSNRVVVLDKGCVLEYDAPAALLQKRSSMFCAMARDAGLA